MSSKFTIDLEPLPELNRARCRVLARLVGYVLSFGTYLPFFPVWYKFDLFLAIASTLFAFVVMGIVRAKMRNISIPITQQEYQYNDRAIATWFVAKRTACDESLTVD